MRSRRGGRLDNSKFVFRNVKSAVGPYTGAAGDGATDDTPVIQAHKAALGAYGGALFFPCGEYKVDTTAGALIDVGAGAPIVLIGETAGKVGNNAATIYGSRIRRSAGTNPLYKVTGTGTTGNGRGHGGVIRLELHGGDLAGTLVRLDQVNEIDFEQARIGHTTGTALHCTQIWNSRFAGCFFTNSGTGTATPAVLLDALNANVSASVTVHFSDCEFEANTGTDIKLTGSSANLRPCNGVYFSNTKMEWVGTGRTWPFIDLDYAQLIHFANTTIDCQGDVAATNRLIEVRDHGLTGLRDVSFSNLSMWHDAVPSEYMVIRRGPRVMISNLYCHGAGPTNKYVQIASTVGLGDVRIAGYVPSSQAKAGEDLRTGTDLFRGTRRLPIDRTAGPTAAELSSGVAVWDLGDSATGAISGNLQVPEDAAPARPVTVRVRWISAATAGDVQMFANFRSYAAGADMTTAQSGGATAVATAPGTASQLATTDLLTTLNAGPGEILTFKFFRNGAGGSDTMVGNMRLVSLDLLYERQL